MIFLLRLKYNQFEVNILRVGVILLEVRLRSFLDFFYDICFLVCTMYTRKDLCAHDMFPSLHTLSIPFYVCKARIQNFKTRVHIIKTFQIGLNS